MTLGNECIVAKLWSINNNKFHSPNCFADEYFTCKIIGYKTSVQCHCSLATFCRIWTFENVQKVIESLHFWFGCLSLHLFRFNWWSDYQKICSSKLVKISSIRLSFSNNASVHRGKKQNRINVIKQSTKQYSNLNVEYIMKISLPKLDKPLFWVRCMWCGKALKAPVCMHSICVMCLVSKYIYTHLAYTYIQKLAQIQKRFLTFVSKTRSASKRIREAEED